MYILPSFDCVVVEHSLMTSQPDVTTSLGLLYAFVSRVKLGSCLLFYANSYDNRSGMCSGLVVIVMKYPGREMFFLRGFRTPVMVLFAYSQSNLNYKTSVPLITKIPWLSSGGNVRYSQKVIVLNGLIWVTIVKFSILSEWRTVPRRCFKT